MWDNLTLKQKAEVMKLAVQQGISDLDSIRDLYNASVNTYDNGGKLNEVIITPDKDYNVFLNSLPENQKYGKDYNTRRYWELKGKPKDFKSSLQSPYSMYKLNEDGLYHASSIAYNKDNDTYEFMKSPDHPTIDLELLQYWNSDKLENFRREYGLDMDSNPYKYVRRTSTNKFLYGNGGPKNNKKKSSGYSPSTSIKKQIAQWEGASMHSPAPDTGKVNRSFDDEAKDFNAVNRSLPGFNALPQASKDALFSYASSSSSLLGFLPSIKFDKGGSKINQQDLDRNNWRWATRDELQEDDPLINTLGDNDKWIVNSEGRLVPTSKVNEWLNSYERQIPYQEQNDIATAREVEKMAVDRYVNSIGFSPIGQKVKDTAEMLVRYPIQYFVSSFRPSSTYIDLSNEKVATIDANTKNVNSILFNDFLEHSKDSARPAKDFYNTQDTLIGDKDIPLSNIKTFYGVEDGKLKVGSLDIFDKNTIVVPNRAKGSKEKLAKVILSEEPEEQKKIRNKQVKKGRQYIETKAKEMGVKPSIMDKILFPIHSLIQGYPSYFTITTELGQDKYAELASEAFDKFPFVPAGEYTGWLGITHGGDTIPIQMGEPKVFFGNEEGKSIFISDPKKNLEKINSFLSQNPSYIGLPDNGRFSGYQTNFPSFASYRGIGTLPMYTIGTLTQ